MIAAYRDLPPPLKELIDWDQQRLDVQVKYDQVVQHFSPERLPPPDEEAAERGGRARRPARGREPPGPRPAWRRDPRRRVADAGLPARIGLVTDGTAAASNFARVVGWRNDEYAGERPDRRPRPRPAAARARPAGISPMPASSRSCSPARCATTSSTACDIARSGPRRLGRAGAPAGGSQVDRQPAREHPRPLDRLLACRRRPTRTSSTSS